jgi:hypothetical protein
MMMMKETVEDYAAKGRYVGMMDASRGAFGAAIQQPPMMNPYSRTMPPMYHPMSL